ncbi:unnamed protein product [Amoebophrya sp. A25]|nr:unnamed protein product [Amoebophrya sp. A25]|eukprot:GSA25T00005776001.1
MRVTIRYDGENALVIRVTLPESKTKEMTARKLVQLFAKQYDKKFATELAVAEHYLKVVGGGSLRDEQLLADHLPAEGGEVNILPNDKSTASSAGGAATSFSAGHAAAANGNSTMPAASDVKSSADPASTKLRISAAVAGPTAGASSSTLTAAEQERKAAQEAGKLRCKNFGCNKYFLESENHDGACRHHKSAPIFHETAKWWSCCPNTKAYDWDEFQKIPGCQWGRHSNVAAKKQVLGGVDLREANAPQRIDDGPMEPRKKLDLLRKGMSVCGVAEDIFDKAWGRCMVKCGGSLDAVVDRMAQACEQALVSVQSDDVNGMD